MKKNENLATKYLFWRCYYLIYIVIITLILPHNANLFAFKWNLQTNDTLNISLDGYVTIQQGGKLEKHYWENNVIALSVVKIDEQGALLRGSIKILNGGKVKPAQLQKQVNTHFIIANNGAYQVEKEVTLPNVRSLPTFPNDEVQKDDKWSAPVQIHYADFTPAFTLQTDVTYHYQTRNDNVAKISYHYQLEEDIASQINVEKPYPLAKVLVLCEGLIHWNVNTNTPILEERYFYQTFIPKSGPTQTYVMQSVMKYHITQPLSEKTMRDIQNQLNSNTTNNQNAIQTSYDEKGITLTLQDILFDNNSHQLKTENISLLKTISDVLKKHKTYQIVVLGHSDSIGSRQYNLKLSNKRAAAVAKALDNFSEGELRIYYEGKGESEPVADNKTKKGQQQNRRVEIRLMQSGK